MLDPSRLGDRVLLTAGAAEQALRVETPDGALRGYLIDVDERDILIYAGYPRQGRELELVWTVALLPRDRIILLERTRIEEEAQEVQDAYRAMVEDRFVTLWDAVSKTEKGQS